MKKHIIAAAVAAAVAVPAMAQNLTVSGAMEAGYRKDSINNVDDHTVSGNVLVTNFIRFSGTEDLGGGLKATFNLTDEFNTNQGAQTAAGDVFEESSLALAGNFGTVKLGRFNHAARDAGGVYRFGNEFMRLSGDFRSLGSQPSNSIQYTTPAMNGLTVSVGYSNGGGKAPAALAASTAAATGANQLSVAASYVNGPVQVAFGRTNADVAAANTNSETLIGGQYDFGAFKVGAVFAKETPGAVGAEDASATVINVAVPLGSGVTLIASVHSVTEDRNGSADGYGFAIIKDMSKRTSLYGGYASIRNTADMSAAYDVHGLGTLGRTDSTFVAGVRHTF